jgi:hypothetical protein
MSLARFDVRLRPEGVEVAVNGAAIPGVRSVRAQGTEGVVARVLIEAVGEVHVEGVGVVEADAAELDDLLSAIDPGVLEAQVLEGLSLGDEGPMAARYLEAIRRYVRGD